MYSAVAPSKQRSKLVIPKFLNPFATSSASNNAGANDGNEAAESTAQMSPARDESQQPSTKRMSQLSAFVFGQRRRSSEDAADQGAVGDEAVEEAVLSAHIAPHYYSLLSPSLEDPCAPRTPLAEEMPGLERTLSVLSTNTLSQMVEGRQELPHVPNYYRVPTAKQAFYDTHMGSSSGWTSLKGKADTVLKPFGGGSTIDTRRRSGEKTFGRDERGTSPAIGVRAQADPQNQKQEQIRVPSTQSARQSKTGWSSRLSTDILPPSLTGISIFGSPFTNNQTQHPDLDVVPVIGPRHSRASEFFNGVKGYNVVLLGGYRGSVLRDAKARHMVWIPLKVGAGLRRPTLELGLSPSAEENAAQLIQPDETLSRIAMMVDMSFRLQSKLARKGANVYPWGYDWRLSLRQSSKRLQAFLEELYETSSEIPSERKGAIVIAHSMGGLVALHALSQVSDPRVFHTLTFGSSPFLGTPNILGPLAYGDAALYNTSICSPRSTFSWRSTFYLLPRDKLCFETESGEKKEVDFLDIKTWEWAGLSPMIRSTRRWQDHQSSPSHPSDSGEAMSLSSPDSKKHYRHKESVKADEAHGPSEAPGAAPIDGPSLSKPQLIEGGDQSNPPPLSNDWPSNAASDGLSAAQHVAQSGQEMTSGGKTDDLQRLNAENREGESGEARGEAGPSETDEDEIWSYLKRTLQEVRTFDEEVTSGFDGAKLANGHYPPITMLTSGRTPTTRGALVLTNSSDDTKVAHGLSGHSNPLEKDWRTTVRSSDYSRMLYGKGDGVITLRSSTGIPGEWKKCLVTDDEDVGEGGEKRLSWLTESSHRHVSLFSDVDGVGRAIWIAMRKRDRMKRSS